MMAETQNQSNQQKQQQQPHLHEARVYQQFCCSETSNFVTKSSYGNGNINSNNSIISLSIPQQQQEQQNRVLRFPLSTVKNVPWFLQQPQLGAVPTAAATTSNLEILSSKNWRNYDTKRSQNGEEDKIPILKSVKDKISKRRRRQRHTYHMQTLVQDERQCDWCGATTTPEWRKGPENVELCNACGLQLQIYKKNFKKSKQKLSINHLLNG